MKKNDLEFEVYSGDLFPYANTTILYSGDEALVIDTQFQKTDARILAKKIKDKGKRLTTIFITHKHPDHVWGGVELMKEFPDAKAYTRKAIINEINNEFRARLLRWTGHLDTEIPKELYTITPYEKDTFDFNGHSIRLMNCKPCETIHMIAYYIPDLKVYASGDQLYVGYHPYVGAGLNLPELWIESIEERVNDTSLNIEHVVPGHGKPGGRELFEIALDYLRTYRDIAKPLVSQKIILDRLLEKYPDWGLKIIAYMTIGPAITAPEIITKAVGKKDLMDKCKC